MPLKTLVIFWSVKQGAQEIALKRGVDILAATPARMLDFIQQGIISLRNLEIFVLDEVDKMLNTSFLHELKRILKSLPPKRQTLFFSATFPKEINEPVQSNFTIP